MTQTSKTKSVIDARCLTLLQFVAIRGGDHVLDYDPRLGVLLNIDPAPGCAVFALQNIVTTRHYPAPYGRIDEENVSRRSVSILREEYEILRVDKDRWVLAMSSNRETARQQAVRLYMQFLLATKTL